MGKSKKNIFIMLAIVLLLAVGVVLVVGYSLGWGAAGADSSASADEGDPVNPGEEPTPTTYLVTFVSAVGVIDEPERTLTELKVSDMPVLTSAYHDFLGWFTTDVVAEQNDLTAVKPTNDKPYALTKDITVYASWRANGTAIPVGSVKALKAIAADMSANYYLTQNIDLSNEEWVPIGMSYERSQDENKQDKIVMRALNPFMGTFDGMGKTISGLNFSPPAEEAEYQYMPFGLFAKVGGTVDRVDGGETVQDPRPGTIKNLKLTGVRAMLDGDFSGYYIGGVAGLLDSGSTIANCSVTGRILNTELEYEGGILDDFVGSFASPTSNTFFGGVVGGIVSGTVSNCQMQNGMVKSQSVADGVFVGGIAGFNWGGLVTNCVSGADVQGRYVGGLVGYNHSTIERSIAMGRVNGSEMYPAVAGGLVGYNDIGGIISESVAQGDVQARTAGGLVGVNMFNYSKAGPHSLGGAPVMNALGIGDNKNYRIPPGKGGKIFDCYAKGSVSATEYGGGLIGRAESNIPVKGTESGIDKNENPYGLKDGSNGLDNIDNQFYFIANCLAYGDVRVVGKKIAYKGEDGKWVVPKDNGVYHPVFAGGLIGHASEIRIRSSVAYGNVLATSKRPTGVDGDEYINNSAYASNAIGHSQVVMTNEQFDTVHAYNVFGVEGQTVERNGNKTHDFNSAPTLYAGAVTQAALTEAFFVGAHESGLGLGFSKAVWDYHADGVGKNTPLNLKNVLYD